MPKKLSTPADRVPLNAPVSTRTTGAPCARGVLAFAAGAVSSNSAADRQPSRTRIAASDRVDNSSTPSSYRPRSSPYRRTPARYRPINAFRVAPIGLIRWRPVVGELLHFLKWDGLLRPVGP